MADITNVEAVKFCNEKIRVMADLLGQCYFTAKAIQAEWNANNMGTLLPVAADVVVDGAAADGRHPITSNDAQVVMGLINSFVADYEADTNTKLNGVLNVAVNYQSKV